MPTWQVPGEPIVCPELLAEIGEALRKPYFSAQLGESTVDDVVAGIAEAATVLDDPAASKPCYETQRTTISSL